jgi:hypothetical protein
MCTDEDVLDVLASFAWLLTRPSMPQAVGSCFFGDYHMGKQSMRIQIISDRESVESLSQVAAANSVMTEPSELTESDQRFGIAEAAAIIAIVYQAAQIAELLVKTYKALRGRKMVTIKTPKGSVTLEVDSSATVEVILKKIQEAGIM